MQQTLTRTLIEAIVRSKLDDLKKSPERTTRNLVDMALHFSRGRFQKRFFEIAQSMLQNEKSPYYQLIYQTVSNVKQERLLQYGMNLGYNSCTYGAEIIRKTEEKNGFNVPWCITLHLNKDLLESSPERYHHLLQEGKALGIYTWNIISNGCIGEFLPIIEMNPDIAFHCFCESDEITEATLISYATIYNIMFFIHYKEEQTEIFHILREQGFLYSAYLYYEDKLLDNILNNELLCAINETLSVFAVLFPTSHCSDNVRRKVENYVMDAIHSPEYKTIPLEFLHVIQRIDEIISTDSCLVSFQQDGTISYIYKNGTMTSKLSHLTCTLSDILSDIFPKQ